VIYALDTADFVQARPVNPLFASGMLLAERGAKLKRLLNLSSVKLRQNARKQFENLRPVYILRQT
jgi:hypothetical protein